MAKFCQNCGSPLGEGVRFCPSCGSSVPQAAQLKWLSVRTLAPGEAARFRERVQREEADYQALLAEALNGML